MINREKFYESLRLKKIVTKRVTGFDYYSIKLIHEEKMEEDKQSPLDFIDDKIETVLVIPTDAISPVPKEPICPKGQPL